MKIKNKDRYRGETMRKSEENYRNIFENCMEGIYQTTPEGRFIGANPSAARLLGYDSPEDLINSIKDIGSQVYAQPEDRDMVLGLLRQCGVVEKHEMKYRRKDGSVAWGLHNIRIVPDDKANMARIEGTFQDITARKLAEESLRLHDEILKNMAEGVCLIQTDEGVIAYANPRFEQMFGYDPHELVGKRVSVLNARDARDPEEDARDIIDHLNTMGVWSGDIRNIKKDGTILWSHANISTFNHPRYGNVWVGVHEDITDGKRMEEALKKSEQRFRSLSEASLEAIVFIEDGVIVDANEALKHLFGYEGEDLKGKLATDFIVPEKRPFTDERMRTRTVGAYETFGLRKDGSIFPIEVNAREYEHDGKKLRISAVRDLTEYKKIEKQLKDYQEHLERLVEGRTSELKESEEKYRGIFENAVIGIFQSTPEGQFLSVNPALARMHGYDSPEEFIASITNIGTEVYADPDRRKAFMDLAESEGIARDFEAQVQTRDGFSKYVTMNARAVKDEQGKTLYFECMVQDITEKKWADEQMMFQYNLAMKLAQTGSLTEGLSIILKSAVAASGMECGSISLKNRKTGGFDLVSSIGLTKEFQEKVEHIPVGSLSWSRIMEKKSLHICPSKDITPIAFAEGFKFISVVPILQADEVGGFLVATSKVLTQIPEPVRIGLELLAAESGGVIARMQARQQLEGEITIRKEAEKALEAERRNLKEANTSLMEANTALKVLLKHRDEDRKELEERFLSNVQQLVMPHVKKLKMGALDQVQRMSLGFIESNLSELVSPFLKTIQGFKFTPRQLEVITLIREGRSTKDIAQILNMNERAVEKQRLFIRKKLGLNKDKTNLQAYLKSLS